MCFPTGPPRSFSRAMRRQRPTRARDVSDVAPSHDLLGPQPASFLLRAPLLVSTFASSTHHAISLTELQLLIHLNFAIFGGLCSFPSPRHEISPPFFRTTAIRRGLDRQDLQRGPLALPEFEAGRPVHQMVKSFRPQDRIN